MAHYRLGVFHDNNAREAQAIPHYRRALRLGLSAKTRAEALAWLASSLYKNGDLAAALRTSRRALQATRDTRLRRFVEGLQQRIARKRAGQRGSR